MARNLAKIQAGHYPFPPEDIAQIADRLAVEPQHAGKAFALLDAGAGDGTALATLREHMLRRYPDTRFPLWGVECDQHRAAQAHERFAPTGGKCLCASMEHSTPTTPTSLLWFNPPYDQVRKEGRKETELFSIVHDWPKAGTGILVMIVPDYVFKSIKCDLEYNFEGVTAFRTRPDDEFKRCVVMARRRERPRWDPGDEDPLAEPKLWTYTLAPASVRSLKRSQLDDATLVCAACASRLHNVLLREAARPARVVERPPGLLGPGHMAQLVLCGMCDGPTQTRDGRQAVLRATTLSGLPEREDLSRDIMDGKGRVIKHARVQQTDYEALVRALRPDGTIENYSSRGD